MHHLIILGLVKEFKTLRCNLKDFCLKGVTPDKLHHLEELIATHAPSLVPLMQVLLSQVDTSQPMVQCPRAWSNLITALASQSPVCALIHPSDRIFDILKKITDDDFTSNPLNMEILQEEFPVLFEVLRDVTHIPKQAINILI